MKIEDRYVHIGRKIREAREESQMSQKTLADALGFESATAISLIEAGERKIAIDILEKVAVTLHKDISFFLDYEEEKTADVRFALRSDKDLDTKDKEAILRFYEAVKKKKDGQ